MTKTSVWTAFAMVIVIAAAMAYGIAITRFTYEYYTGLPQPEVKIVHEYAEGYFDGYQAGKYQALDEADEVGL